MSDVPVTDDSSPRGQFWHPIAVVGLTFTVFFASQALGGLLVSIYPALRHWSAAQTEAWFKNSTFAEFALIAAIELLAIGMVYGLLKIKKQSWQFIGLAWPKWKDVLYALAGFGVYIVLYVAGLTLIKAIFPSLNVDQEQQIGFENAQGVLDLILVALSLVVFPPIAEEILTRGFLYCGLRRKVRLLPAALITSSLFALAHLQPGSGEPLLWVAAIDTFILSLVLVYLREKTGKLAAPMMVHMLKNTMAFIFLFIIIK